MKRIVVKTPVERMRERADRNMAYVEDLASEHLVRLAKAGPDGDKRWDEVTVRDKVAMAFAGFHASRSRAKIGAEMGPRVFGLVVMPSQITDKAAWEAKYKALQGRRHVVDTTAGPALPVREEDQ